MDFKYHNIINIQPKIFVKLMKRFPIFPFFISQVVSDRQQIVPNDYLKNKFFSVRFKLEKQTLSPVRQLVVYPS